MPLILLLNLLILLPGVGFSVLFALKAGRAYDRMMKNRTEEAMAQGPFYTLKSYTDASRYTEVGNEYRERGNRLLLKAVLTALVMTVLLSLLVLLVPEG